MKTRTDEEIRQVYTASPTAREAAIRLGLSKYRMALAITRLSLPKKVYQLQGGKRPRHWGHSIYEAVDTGR